MSQQITIALISIKDNLTTVDELVGALHLSELSLNTKTANWKDIKNEYLQYMMECEKEADGKFFVANRHDKAIGFIFGFVEYKDNSNFEVGEGDVVENASASEFDGWRCVGICGTELSASCPQHH